MPELTIARAHSPSPETFQRDFLAPERPVILTGLTDRWRAVGLWTPEYFKAMIPNLGIRYECWDRSAGAAEEVFDYIAQRTFRRARMADFVDLLDRPSGHLVYSTNFPIFDSAPGLARDVEPLDEYMAIPRSYPGFLRRICQVEPYLWTGPAGAVSLLHFDRVHNLHVQIYGRKKWLILSPGHFDRTYWPCDALGPDMLQFSPVNAERPDLVRFPRFAAASPIEVILEPGEVLFLPAAWWHQVRGVTAAISMNFFWFDLRNLRALSPYFYHATRLALRGDERVTRERDSSAADIGRVIARIRGKLRAAAR